MKKLIALLISVLLVALCVVGLVACNPNEGGSDAKFKYNINVWVGEGTKELTERLITKFNETNTYSIYFNASVKQLSESVAVGDITSKPESAPEIFCFAQDQIARLVSKDLLLQPSSSIADAVKAVNTQTAVAAASMGDTLYAYPLTEDNGYFLYYDKKYISEEQADSIEAIVAACQSQNKFFSFNIEGGWYAASFFYAKDVETNESLCKSEWTVNAQGRFTAHDDSFTSANGRIAVEGIKKVFACSRYRASASVDDFSASTGAAAVVSGIWDYENAKRILGDDLGIAQLPTFTANNGHTYRLASFLGSKLMGVTPQVGDTQKNSALSLLAQFLTNEQSQLARFEAFGWRPSVATAQEQDDVKAHIALIKLLATATVPQGQYPYDWWAAAETMVGSMKTAVSDDDITNAFNIYNGKLDGFING